MFKIKQSNIVLNFFLILAIILFFNNISFSQLLMSVNNYKKEVFKNKDNTFGYKILKDSKPMINQESMPAVPGNKGFPRKIDAERMADLVIFKIKNGVMPPTVTVMEVDSIKAIK